MPLHVKERLSSYSRPLHILPTVLSSLYTVICEHGLNALHARTFTHWLVKLGPGFKAYEDNTPVATLTPLASGVVIDVGAGCGNQIARFSKDNVEKVYGVEPNPFLFETLVKRATARGLEGVYIPITCDIEDSSTLASHGITPGSIDSIVCMQVLCSVQSPKETMQQFHRLLKPGGRLYFWEHQRSSDFVTRWMQKFWDPIWRVMVGGCCLNREIESVILGDGKMWEVLEWETDEMGGWGMLPRVWGVLGKK